MYQYSTGLSTREVSSSKSISYSKKEAFVLPACYFSEVTKLSYFTSLLKTFIWFFFFSFVLIVLILFSVLFHHTSVSLPEVLWVLAGIVSRTLLHKTYFLLIIIIIKLLLLWNSKTRKHSVHVLKQLLRNNTSPVRFLLMKTPSLSDFWKQLKCRDICCGCAQNQLGSQDGLCPLTSHCKNGTLPQSWPWKQYIHTQTYLNLIC